VCAKTLLLLSLHASEVGPALDPSLTVQTLALCMKSAAEETMVLDCLRAVSTLAGTFWEMLIQNKRL
jgi:hypothetical protein